MGEERLIELEIKVAYQDDLLQSLNNIVTDQQQQIDRLAIVCRVLSEQLKNITDAQNDDRHIDQTPPHY